MEAGASQRSQARRNIKHFKVGVHEMEARWDNAAYTGSPALQEPGRRMLAYLEEMIRFLEMDEPARLRIDTMRESMRDQVDLLATLPWHDEPPPRAISIAERLSGGSPRAHRRTTDRHEDWEARPASRPLHSPLQLLAHAAMLSASLWPSRRPRRNLNTSEMSRHHAFCRMTGVSAQLSLVSHAPGVQAGLSMLITVPS